MGSDLATEITVRVKSLLNSLSRASISRWVPALPFLGQEVWTRYSNWLDELLSRLHLAPVLMLWLGQRSDFRALPLSYTWFDMRWISRLKRPRPIRKQTQYEDEENQNLTLHDTFFEEDAAEDVAKRPQWRQWANADDTMLSLPTQVTLSAESMELARTRQLARNITLKPELLTNKSLPTAEHTPFETGDVGYYPNLAAHSTSFLDKFKRKIADRCSGDSKEGLHRYDLPELPLLSFHPLSGQYTETMSTASVGKLASTVSLQMRAAPPLLLAQEGTRFDYQQSAALPIAPGQPTSEGGVAFISQVCEPGSVLTGNIVARRVFSPLRNLLGISPVASSVNRAVKALADSFSHPFEAPFATSDTVLDGESDGPHTFRPRGPRLRGRQDTLGMADVAYGYVPSVAVELPSDKGWQGWQAPPQDWSGRHILRSLTEEAIRQGMREHGEATASAVKTSALDNCNKSVGVELALAPIGRRRESASSPTSGAEGMGQEAALQAASQITPAYDPEAVASEVYSILKRRLRVEKERTTSVVS